MFIVAAVGAAVLVLLTFSAIVTSLVAISASLVVVEEFSPAVESSKSSKTEFV